MRNEYDKSKLIPVYDGPDSTQFSWNGTCPESPDGRRITYFRQPCPPPEEKFWNFTGQIWVCDRDFTNHRKVFEMPMRHKGFQHNGGKAMWVDNHRLAFRDTGRIYPLETIYVVNADTGEVLYEPIVTGEGRVTHDLVNHKLPFGICTDEEVKQNRQAYPEIDDPGIYFLDCDSSKVEKIVSLKKITAFLRSRGFTPIEKFGHLAPNFDFSRLMVTWWVEEQRAPVVSFGPNGENMTALPDNPLHQRYPLLHHLWFDNETVFGADWTNDISGADERRRICRYRQYDGTKLELLAGQGNHIDGSPDRQWFVGDSKGFEWAPPHRIRLFRRGQIEPVAELARHEFDWPVMRIRAHANPAFSRDGKRVYFNHMVGETHELAFCADISRIVQSGK